MHHNFLFDLDQTLLDFHASEYKALGIVPMMNCIGFSKSGRPGDERKLTEEYQWKKDGFSI